MKKFIGKLLTTMAMWFVDHKEITEHTEEKFDLLESKQHARNLVDKACNILNQKEMGKHTAKNYTEKYTDQDYIISQIDEGKPCREYEETASTILQVTKQQLIKAGVKPGAEIFFENVETKRAIKELDNYYKGRKNAITTEDLVEEDSLKFKIAPRETTKKPLISIAPQHS
jgi:hypothetical protein